MNGLDYGLDIEPALCVFCSNKAEGWLAIRLSIGEQTYKNLMSVMSCRDHARYITPGMDVDLDAGEFKPWEADDEG